MTRSCRESPGWMSTSVPFRKSCSIAGLICRRSLPPGLEPCTAIAGISRRRCRRTNCATCEFYGLAILSRIPLRWVASFQLGPQNTGRIASAESEPRILQVATPQLDRLVIIGNTHLAATDWSLSPTRRSQAERIADIVRSITTPGPLILCGDFNAGPSSSDLTELRRVLPHAYASKEGTFIGEEDRPPIDFFCSATALAVEVSVFPAEGLSDHNIVVATL
jgi:endonuclease/exonuclease/phosphatase (EEP) superfamily protein YafD